MSWVEDTVIVPHFFTCRSYQPQPLFFFLIVYTLLPLSGNLGRLTWVRLQQPQEQHYPVLQVYAGSFRVSVIHQTLTCTWSFICVSTLSRSQHNIFDSEKLSQIFLVLLMGQGFEPRVFGSRVQRSSHWATPSPQPLNLRKDTVSDFGTRMSSSLKVTIFTRTVSF